MYKLFNHCVCILIFLRQSSRKKQENCIFSPIFLYWSRYDLAKPSAGAQKRKKRPFERAFVLARLAAGRRGARRGQFVRLSYQPLGTGENRLGQRCLHPLQQVLRRLPGFLRAQRRRRQNVRDRRGALQEVRFMRGCVPGEGFKVGRCVIEIHQNAHCLVAPAKAGAS